MGVPTNYINSSGVDIGIPLVPKSYLIDRYPELADTFKQAGLWLWGRNQYGQLGDNTIVNKSSPIQTISGGTNWRLVASSAYNTASIKTDGTLWLWGDNYYGQLGNNASDPPPPQSSPVQTVSGGTNWKQISIGYKSVAAIKTDGTLWLWGSNRFGNLGDNTTAFKKSPVQTVSGGTNWKYVSSGIWTTAAIKTDGTLWIWGWNNSGKLGDNTITDKSSPVQTISGGTNWKQVSTGTASSIAIKTDGTLWLWGSNVSGRLGDNTIVNKSSPVQTIAGGNNWKQCVSFSAAIKTDGTLWLWGSNSYGNLGDNTTVNKSSPVQTVSGGTNWKQASSESVNFLAIKTDGTFWLWGRNSEGQLGNNSITNVSSPIQTVAGGTNWKQVYSGLGGSSSAIQDNSADMFGNPL